MPIEVWYIVALLAVIVVTFLLLKRPIYESMFYGYVLMVVLTGEYKNFFAYIGKTSTDTLFTLLWRSSCWQKSWMRHMPLIL